MKLATVLRLISFLIVLAAPKFAVADKISGTIPIVLHIPNTERFSESTTIHIHANLGIPQGVTVREIAPTVPKGFTEPITIRTNSAFDGKVDVDIIIRIEYFATKLLPFVNQPEVRIEVGVMSFITVDNISGVFQNGTDHHPINLQDVSIIIKDDNDNQESTNITNVSSLNLGELQLSELTSLAPLKKQLTDITLYPNPVNGSVLNIATKTEMEGLTEIVIYNAIGNLVKKQSNIQTIDNTTIQVNIEELTNGIYFLTLRSVGGDSVKKFTVAH